MRELDCQWKWARALSHTRTLVQSELIESEIVKCFHISQFYALFTLDGYVNYQFYYAFTKDKECNIIQSKSYHIELWDYYREGFEGYKFVKSIAPNRIEEDSSNLSV